MWRVSDSLSCMGGLLGVGNVGCSWHIANKQLGHMVGYESPRPCGTGRTEPRATRPAQAHLVGLHDARLFVPSMQEHLADVLPTVQCALTDSDGGVREAAGAAFGILFKGQGGAGGGSAVDSVVPSMLAGLEHDKRFRESLEGLRVILQVRPQIFHFACPKLLHKPLQLNNVRALGELAAAADTHLNNHLDAIMPALLGAASGSRHVAATEHPDSEELAAEGRRAAAAAAAAVAAAVDEEGLHLLVPQMVKVGGRGGRGMDGRVWCCLLVSEGCKVWVVGRTWPVPQLVKVGYSVLCGALWRRRGSPTSTDPYSHNA